MALQAVTTPGDRIVTLLYEWRRRELEEHRREPNVWWVTDLVRCPLKRQFELKFPEVASAQLLNPRLILGDIVHYGVEALLKNILGPLVKVETDGELERERRVALGDGEEVVVRGRIDAIVYDPESETMYGVEVKYSNGAGGAPYQHHVEQAMVYNWLYNLPETLLVYITPEGVYEYIVRQSVDEKWVAQRVRDKRAPRYDWECRYCEFRSICPRRKT